MTNVNYGMTVPISTVDDLGHASIVLFFRGCTLNCWYCHNKELNKDSNIIDIEQLKRDIKASSLYVSSVTFSGGEPTLQCNVIKELIPYIKTLGLEVCVYTSGAYPDLLKEIVHGIDRCYIDIKTESAMITFDYKQYLKNVMRTFSILEDAKVGTFVTMVAFDTTEDTIDEIDTFKYFLGDKHFTVIQGICGTGAVRVMPDEMKASFTDCYIRTKENGVEWNGST